MEETRKYKQTELGLLPEDWEVVKLGDIGYFLKGNGISKSQANSGDLCAVRYGELYTLHHNYIKTYNSHISKEVALFATKIQKGDILFACSGETKEEIGKCAAFVDEVEAYAGGDILILRTDQEKCSDIFLGFLLNMPIAANQKEAKGQGDAVVHISKASLENLSIPLPPIEEQRRIASALTSIDNLIDSLDRLIAKKRAIKQGVMQQLLSGKKRLKGFTEPWVEKRLGEILSLKNGFAFKSETYCAIGKYKIITIANVQNGRFDLTDYNSVTDIPASIQQHQKLSIGDILISMTGNVGRVCRVDSSNCLLNQRVGLLEIRPNVNSDFVFTALNTNAFENAMRDKGQGAAQANISKSDIEDYVLLMPSSLLEQQAIASVLTSMDNELSALEAKRQKYEQIKRGMMQQLLTGRIRLK